MRKFKIFLTGFLPLITCTVLQYAAVMLMLLATTIRSLQGRFSQTPSNAISSLMKLTASSDFQSMIMIMYTIMGLCIFGMWYVLRCEGSLGPHTCHYGRLSRFGAFLCLVPGLQFFSAVLTSIVGAIFPWLLDEYEMLLEVAGFTEAPSVILLLYSIVFAPFCEELIFRGVTLRIFQRIFRSFWTANLMQALLFGIFHGNWVQGIYTFVVGFVFGYVCEYGGSIWDSILLHMMFNVWGMLVSEYLDLLPDLLITNILIFVSIPVFLGLGLYLFRKSQKR